MRKTLMTLFLAATLPVLGSMAQAADNMPPMDDSPMIAGPMGGMHGDGPNDGHGRGEGGPMLRGMDLTAEQRGKLGDVMREEMQFRRDLVQRYLDKLPAAEKAAMKKEEEAARTRRDKEVEALLKPEQFKRYQEMRSEMDKRRAEREEFEAWKAARNKTTH